VLIGDPEDSFPHDEHVWLLLDRYLDGDPAAIEVVRPWLAGDPRRVAIVRDLRAIREAASAIVPERRIDAAWNRFLAETDRWPAYDATDPEQREAQGPRAVLHRMRSRSWPSRRRWAARAAALLLVAGTVWWAREELGIPGGRSGQSQHMFIAAKGQRASIRLADGTKVTLAPDSRLIVPASFDRTNREVTLEGRAYFDVQHRDALPFIVHVQNIVIRDFGTRFGVRGYSGDSAVRVLVTDGRATVRSDLTPAIPGPMLEPGMEATLNAAGSTSIRSAVDTAPSLGWRTGMLEFSGARLSELAAEFSRWYDVDVVFADHDLAARRVSVRFEDDSLPLVLRQLAIAASVHVTLRGRTVVMSAGESGEQH